MLLSKLRNKIIGEVTTSKDIPQLDIDDIISFQDCAIKLISEQSIKVIDQQTITNEATNLNLTIYDAYIMNDSNSNEQIISLTHQIFNQSLYLEILLEVRTDELKKVLNINSLRQLFQHDKPAQKLSVTTKIQNEFIAKNYQLASSHYDCLHNIEEAILQCDYYVLKSTNPHQNQIHISVYDDGRMTCKFSRLSRLKTWHHQANQN